MVKLSTQCVRRAGASSTGHVLNEMFEAMCEEGLQQPTFVMDHPVDISPLAKPHRCKPGCVERWELFIAGARLHLPSQSRAPPAFLPTGPISCDL